MEPIALSPRDPFMDLVRDALLHLYETTYLQTHVFAKYVGPETATGTSARGKVLLRTLLDAVESLRPEPGTPADSRVWRSYRILELRYVEGVPAAEVLEHLSISRTQYQRDHNRALEAIASLLRDSWHIPLSEGASQQPTDTRQALAISEADTLAAQIVRERVDLARLLNTLRGALDLACQESGITLSLHNPVNLPEVIGDRTVIRQIFLSLLNAAIQHGRQGTLSVTVAVHGATVELSIVARSSQQSITARTNSLDEDPETQVARRLAEALGGTVKVEREPNIGQWHAVISLSVGRMPVLLVLDNHSDFINLIERYMTGQEWRVIGATNVSQAQALLADNRPDAILLDVMMPGQDGWDLLIALKANVKTREIPVIICSVLYEPEMARALGAVSYLAKPMSQGELVRVLEPFRPKGSGLATSFEPRWQ